MLDLIVSRVFGPVTAKDVRIVWSDGKLYIARSSTDVVVFDASEPKRHHSMYQVQVGTESLRFQIPSCGSCKQRVMRSEVGKMSAAEIIAAGSVGADV